MKKIEYFEEIVEISFSEDAQCWASNIRINGTEINFEIDLQFFNQKEIDWKHFEQFLKYISNENRIAEFVKLGIMPIEAIGFTFYNKSVDEIKRWKMMFSNSIIYRGSGKGNNIITDFEYSLVYDFGERLENGNFDGDAYGLYLVDINSNQGINGARRI